MILYYLEYTDELNKTMVEVYKSRTTAKKRVSEMAKAYKELKKAWQEYIITRTNKPSLKPIEPPEVREAQFDLNAEGLMKAFTYLNNRGR